MDEAVLHFVFVRGECMFQNRFRARVAMNDHTGWMRPGAVIGRHAIQTFFNRLKPHLPAKTELVFEENDFRISFYSADAVNRAVPAEAIRLTDDLDCPDGCAHAADGRRLTLDDELNHDGVFGLAWMLNAWFNPPHGYIVEYAPTEIRWIPPRMKSSLPPRSRRTTAGP